MRALTVLWIVAAGTISAAAPQKHPLHEAKASALLPRAVEVAVEIDPAQPAGAVAATLLLINTGAEPVVINGPANFTILSLIAADGTRLEDSDNALRLIPRRDLSTVAIAPHDTVRVPIETRSVFLPEKQKRGGNTISARGLLSGGAIPVPAGTYRVLISTMLVDTTVPAAQTGRFFVSDAITVTVGE